MPSTGPAQAAPIQPAPAFAYLADSYIFRWDVASFRTDWIFVLAVAVCLFAGIALGHPGAGLIAGGGAMTAGFGAKQNIDGTPLLPILFVSFGMAFCTFFGSLAGHRSSALPVIAAVFGFGYGMLTKRGPGHSWVGQQCVVVLLVASAFPATAKQAALHGLIILAGGLVQLLAAAFLLKAFTDLGRRILRLARYVREEEQALRRIYLGAVLSLRHRQLRDSVLPYACRVAIVLAISTEIYRRLHFASGYWIPMTALLVLRPGIADTASRAIARTAGTLAGAVLSSFFLLFIHPPPAGLAALVCLFTWLAYSLVNVNYALFSVVLTSYIIFLLSLDGLPSTDIAQRRFVCTLIGGAIALTVRLTVLRLRQQQDRASLATQRGGSTPALDPAER